LAEVLSFLNVFIGSRTLIIISKENPQLTTIFKNDLYFKKIRLIVNLFIYYYYFFFAELVC